MVVRIWSLLLATHRDERGQDALEYLLVVGAVVVAFIGAFYGWDAMIGAVLKVLCPSVDPAGVAGCFE